MKYNPPVGGAADDPYVNGVPGVSQGSIPPAAAIEDVQREIVNVITGAGLTPDENVLTQLLSAIKSFPIKSMLLAANGYIVFEGGDGNDAPIIQWGSYGATSTTGTTHNYPMVFPNAALQVFCSDPGTATVDTIACQLLSASQFTAKSASGTPGFAFFAIGY